MTTASVCPFHASPDDQECHDCGLPAWNIEEGWRMAHEDFEVHDELWDAVCPDEVVQEWVENGKTFRAGSFVLCIECFEERLGRRLNRDDFKAPPRRQFGRPASYRFRSRWKSRRVES